MRSSDDRPSRPLVRPPDDRARSGVPRAAAQPAGRAPAASAPWSVARELSVAAFLLCVVLLLQFAFGSYGRELGGNADEPSHFLNGLLVRDYLAQGFPEPPVAFARRYYAHYPKIAIGNWPPVFYAVEGVWLLLVPAGVGAAMALMALVATAVSWLVFRALRPAVGTPFALLGATAFLFLRPVPFYVTSVMAELPVTLATTVAVLLWVRLLRRERNRDVLLFGLAAAVAVFTKGNALFLALVPPLATAFTGRWRILRMPALWGTALAALVVVVPWILYYLPTMRAGWPRPGEWFGELHELGFYPTVMLRANGAVLLALAALGAWVRLRRAGARPAEERMLWAGAAAAVVGAVVFHALLPGLLGLRHLTPAYPFLAMFVAAGAAAVADVLRRRVGLRPAVASALAAATAAGPLAWHLLPVQRARISGYGAAAASVRRLAPAAARDSLVVLVASDAQGEGAFVVEAALQDTARPRDVVWRATKLLSQVTWRGSDYALRAETDTGVVTLLERAGVEALVIDRGTEAAPHQRLLERTLASRPERFVHLGDVPAWRRPDGPPRTLALYSVVPPATTPDSVLRQRPGYEGVEAVQAAPPAPRR